MSTGRTTVNAFLVIGLSAMLGACSSDTHFFHSSVDRPTNITVYDVFAKKALWVNEIPVGKTLELDFDRDDEQEWKKVRAQPATLLTWNLYDDTDAPPIACDTIPLPGTPIVIKVSYRETTPSPGN